MFLFHDFLFVRISSLINVNAAKDPVQLERNNLLNVLKLIIKEILDSSLSHGRMLDDNNTALQQFFLVLEHILRHGLKCWSSCQFVMKRIMT